MGIWIRHVLAISLLYGLWRSPPAFLCYTELRVIALALDEVGATPREYLHGPLATEWMPSWSHWHASCWRCLAGNPPTLLRAISCRQERDREIVVLQKHPGQRRVQLSEVRGQAIYLITRGCSSPLSCSNYLRVAAQPTEI